MIEASRWSDFRARAQRDGQLIELTIRELYSSHLPEDAHAIDGGANVGFHTLGLAARLGRGKVLAIEANRQTFATLQDKVKALPQVSPVFCALQDDPELENISFNCSPTHPGRSGVGRIWDLIAPGQVQYGEPDVVPATTLDKLVAENGWGRLDFIKLDLEGGEYNALHGGERALQELRPLVVSEHSVHAQQLNHFKIDEHYGWLEGLGYVPVSPSGDRVTMKNPFPFWYVYLVPKERLDWWAPRIETVLNRHL